jgi:integrase
MIRRKTLTDKGVQALKPRAARYAEPDPELRGLFVRVQPSGSKSFVVVARDPYGKQIWATIGAADVLRIEEARDTAREVIKRIRAGMPAFEAPPVKPDSFADVSSDWLKRHVQANGLRSQNEIERCLGMYVLPAWKDRDFISIRRGDVTRLLDHVQDQHGARQADYVLAITRAIANWHASRHDDYVSPFTRGMRRTDPATRKRARILDDAEIKLIWQAAEGGGRFGAILRLLLLTAQRREKVSAMQWVDVSVDGTWTVPADPRAKGTGGALVLPVAAIDIIRAQPRLGDNPHVFAGSGMGPFSGFSKAKRELDAKLPHMPQWQLHDLRRTARSLMARAGVRPDVAERVMGHAIAGVEGVYDRHSYRDEKTDALKRLAGLVATILNPPKGNVRRIREAVR